jgi:nicotinate-nucleotide adenylyltransferase
VGARTGIFGGTFDPPHIGHLVVADDVAAKLDLEEVWFIPAGAHPLKGEGVVAPGAIRGSMVQAAVEGRPGFRALDVELRRRGPSYSVDTLRELSQTHPGTEFFFLVGTDVANEFHKWREPETIARLARIVVLSRAGDGKGGARSEPQAASPDAEMSWTRVEVTRVDLSSTEVRHRVHAGRPFRYLVPETVYRIITAEGLYR